MLKRLFFILSLIVLPILSGCTDPVEKINELLQAANGELQAKRALTLSEESLKALDRVDMVLSVNRQTLNAVAPKLLNALSASETAKKNQIVFDGADFVFDDQVLAVDLRLSKTINDITIRGRAQASAFVGATAKALHWNLYIDGVEVTDIEGLPWFARKVPEGALELIDKINPILNAVLDEAVNDDPETAVLVKLNKQYLVRENLSEHSSDDFVLDEKTLETGLATRAAAVVITDKGIMVAAKVDFVPPEQVDMTPPSFPADADLVRQSMDGWQDRVATYQGAVGEMASTHMGADNGPLLSGSETGFAVSKPALARLVNFQFTQGTIAGTAIFNEPNDSSSPLTFDIKERDCHKYFAGCDYKRFCEGNRCMEEVDEVYNTTCRVSCCLQTGLLGCIFRGLCDRACQQVRKVTRPITGAACDGFRAADQLYGGALCSIASNVDKAVCDIDANLRKSACDVEQEIGRFYRKNPVATVSSSIQPDARARLVVTGAEMTPDLKQFLVTFRGSGHGTIKAGLRYDRHNYADIAVVPASISLGTACAVDWAESISVDATIQELQDTLAFNVSASAGDQGNLLLTFTQRDEKTLYADFDPPPLVALFVGKPQVTLNCPLAAIGAVVFGSAEAVFTQEDARQVFPLLTGKRYPQKIEKGEIEFKVDLETVTVCAPASKTDCDEPLLALVPGETEKTIRYLVPK